MCGAELINIHTVDMSGLDARVKGINIIAACDVDNPLYGIKGSSNVYGRQKGASETDVQTLDKGLKHFSEIMKFGYGFDFSDYPGAGAAGGLGYGLMCFLGATLASGIETVMRATKFTKRLLVLILCLPAKVELTLKQHLAKPLWSGASCKTNQYSSHCNCR